VVSAQGAGFLALLQVIIRPRISQQQAQTALALALKSSRLQFSHRISYRTGMGTGSCKNEASD